MIHILPHHIFSHTELPALDRYMCAKQYFSVVCSDYCVSLQHNTPFILPKKIKKKRAKLGTFARGYRFVAQPSPAQEKILNRILGASRWVWNWGLNLYLQHIEKHNTKIIQVQSQEQTKIKDKYKALSYIEVSHQLTVLKKTTLPKMKNGVLVQEKHWLNSIPDTVLRQTLMDLGNAWTAYENGQKGLRRDKPGQPKFKSKTNQNDSATFQVDARLESKARCIDQVNSTLKITGLDPIHNRLAFKRTEDILGDISSFVVSKKNGTYYVSLSMINITQNSMTANKVQEHNSDFTTQSKFFDFAYDEYPICSTLNPNREGLLAIDMAAQWGGIATRNGSTTYQLISEEQRHRLTHKENNAKRFQRVQNRKTEAKYNKYGIVREANGAWPKDAGKLLTEKIQERNEKHKRQQSLRIFKDPLLTTEDKQQRIADVKDVFFIKSNRLIDVEQRLSQKHTEKRNDLVDVLHKATTDIIRKNHTVVCETLNVKAMLEDKEKHSGFHRSIANTCMSEIIRQLTYKAKWYGRNMLFVSPWFPSSQLCSTIGCTYQNKTLKLSDTHWTCPMCATYHERNNNASFNLWFQGWHLLEEFFQKNSTKNLADGSFVKGLQGVVEKTVSITEHRAWRKATSKPQKKTVSSTVVRFKKSYDGKHAVTSK